TFGPIDVFDAEVERLTQAETGDGQQSKQTVIGPGAQWVNGGSCSCCVQQFSDFLMGIEVWLSTLRPKRQKAEWRKFGERVGRTPVPGEAAHDGKSRGPLTRCVVRMLRCPLHRQLDGDIGAAFSFQE